MAVASGTAEFRGTSHGPKGETVLNKVRLVGIDAHRVEQTWQKSTDNGATWTTGFVENTPAPIVRENLIKSGFEGDGLQAVR